MKYQIHGVIVVEGTSDVAFLSSFIDAEFVSVNGSAVTLTELKYLVEIAHVKPIYVLTDPDYPGLKIRQIIHDRVPQAIDVFIPKEDAIKRGKLGVAESSQAVVLDAIKKAHIVNAPKEKIGVLTPYDLMRLKLIGHPDAKQRRSKLETIFSVGYTNGKTLLKRLNQRNITTHMIEKVIDEKTP
jgi:ribonuclease M5